MGSGLILLVIVGVWLAVLVPMAVKSHDSAASLKSADKFSDAMRVLSRRTPAERRAVEAPPLAAHERRVPPLTMAERRRRTLFVMVGISLVTLGLALMGSILMLVVHLLSDVLLVGFVVNLRKQAVLKAERAARARRRPAPAPAPARATASAPQVAGVPARMPARPAPLTAPLPAPAARYDEPPVPVPAAATGTEGTWKPVPVPPPTYVGKAVAPSRPPRVLDLTKPGKWTESLEDVGLEILDEGPEIEEILERRRAANGW